MELRKIVKDLKNQGYKVGVNIKSNINVYETLKEKYFFIKKDKEVKEINFEVVRFNKLEPCKSVIKILDIKEV